MQIALVLLPIVAFLSSSARAGSFYTSANNKIYYVESSYNHNWFDAHIECHNKNMSLFTIDDEDSFYDLYNVLISGRFLRNPPNLWIGAIGSQRKFTWIANGKPVIWKYNSFDNFGHSENCLQISENTLDDRNCMHMLGFVCEDNKYATQCDQTMSVQKRIVLNIHQHSHDPN